MWPAIFLRLNSLFGVSLVPVEWYAIDMDTPLQSEGLTNILWSMELPGFAFGFIKKVVFYY